LRFNFSILILITISGIHPVSAQLSPSRYEGRVLNSTDSLPVPFVNIYTVDYTNFTSTSVGGNFSIEINQGDTLNFSAIGFRSKQIVVYFISDIIQIIQLNPVTYELPGLTIYGRDPMEGFYDHNRLYETKTEQTFDQKFPGPSLGVGQSGAAFTGLLTLLANQFNSEYKQLKKLQEIEEGEYTYYRRLELIYSRLNADFISSKTSLRREEVQQFIDFWNPSIEFMEIATEYELVAMILNQEERYFDMIRRNNTGRNVVSTIELRKLLNDYSH